MTLCKMVSIPAACIVESKWHQSLSTSVLANGMLSVVCSNQAKRPKDSWVNGTSQVASCCVASKEGEHADILGQCPRVGNFIEPWVAHVPLPGSRLQLRDLGVCMHTPPPIKARSVVKRWREENRLYKWVSYITEQMQTVNQGGGINTQRHTCMGREWQPGGCRRREQGRHTKEAMATGNPTRWCLQKAGPSTDTKEFGGVHCSGGGAAALLLNQEVQRKNKCVGMKARKKRRVLLCCEFVKLQTFLVCWLQWIGPTEWPFLWNSH